jgi:aquaporin TIP
MAKIALGTAREATQPDCIQALIVEFIATFLFVFAGVGSAMTAGISITLIFIILLIQQ